MANEKVSQMTSLAAAEVAADDLLLITDISAKESKKITTSDFLTYIEATGSFNAYHATLADSASHMMGSGVVGLVGSSSYSLNSNSSSYSLKSSLADIALNALTSSLTFTCVTHTTTADTASFLDYTGILNGTSSYSLTSGLSNFSNTSSTLLYIPGISRNTASYALLSLNSVSSSYSLTSSYSTTSSFSVNSVSSSYALSADTASSLSGFSNPIKAWACLTWSVANAAYPLIYSNYNISSVTWIKTIPLDGGGGPGSAGYWDLYGVVFTNPLPSTNYIMAGGQMVGTYSTSALNPYAISVGIAPVMIWTQERRDTRTFTMSINTGTGIQRTIAFNGNGCTQATFQILGL